jgi:hypothetical protein
MQQPPERLTVLGRRAHERRISRGTDRDVIGMPEHAVRSEGKHDRGLFFHEYLGDGVHQVLEGQLPQLPVRIAQPFVAVRRPPKRSPTCLVLEPADLTQVLAGRIEASADITGTAIGGVHEHKPKVRIPGMKGNAACYAIGIVVRMRHDDHYTLHPGILPPVAAPAANAADTGIYSALRGASCAPSDFIDHGLGSRMGMRAQAIRKSIRRILHCRYSR